MRSSALALVAVAAAIAAGSAGAGSRSVGFFGCRTDVVAHPVPVVRPRSIVLACADANAYLTGLRWTTWTAATATGSGVLHENDCKPYCAAGHFHARAATVALSRPRRCKGALVFTRVDWIARGWRTMLDYRC